MARAALRRGGGQGFRSRPWRGLGDSVHQRDRALVEILSNTQRMSAAGRAGEQTGRRSGGRGLLLLQERDGQRS